MTIQCVLQFSLLLSLLIHSLTLWFHLFWFLYNYKQNFKRGRGKRDRKQHRNLKHKGKHKICCYPKSIMMFTDYQVQGWWTRILSTIKYQPYGINAKEILLKRSWHKHLKHSNPYKFVLQTDNNPPYGFCTHIFFAKTIILIFSGIILHRIFSLLRVNTNWIKLPPVYFQKKV